MRIAALLYLLGLGLIAAGLPTEGLLGVGLSIAGVAFVWAGFFRTIRKVPPR
jgi:hypothetical protein